MRKAKRHTAKHPAKSQHKPRSRPTTFIANESDERNANVQQSFEDLDQPEQSTSQEGGPEREDLGAGE